MNYRMRLWYNKFSSFFLERMAEPTTWQGIGFLVSLTGGKYANLDWGQAAALGGFVSAFIKMVTKG